MLNSLVQIAPYQHVVVVMSIVLGLSVTQLLKGLAQLYRTHNRIRPYWLHTAWVIFLIVFSLMLPRQVNRNLRTLITGVQLKL